MTLKAKSHILKFRRKFIDLLKNDHINCRISNDETAINFLIRLEQKANEARNFDIKISERKFIWTLLNNMKFHRYYKERIASFISLMG